MRRKTTNWGEEPPRHLNKKTAVVDGRHAAVSITCGRPPEGIAHDDRCHSSVDNEFCCGLWSAQFFATVYPVVQLCPCLLLSIDSPHPFLPSNHHWLKCSSPIVRPFIHLFVHCFLPSFHRLPSSFHPPRYVDNADGHIPLVHPLFLACCQEIIGPTTPSRKKRFCE